MYLMNIKFKEAKIKIGGMSFILLPAGAVVGNIYIWKLAISTNGF